MKSSTKLTNALNKLPVYIDGSGGSMWRVSQAEIIAPEREFIRLSDLLKLLETLNENNENETK